MSNLLGNYGYEVIKKKFCAALLESFLDVKVSSMLHPQQQFTFLWLLGNYDETYGVIYEVLNYEKIQGLNGAFCKYVE